MGSVHHGLVHTPFAIQEALKIPEAIAASNKEWEKIRNFRWSEKKVKSKAEVVRHAKKDGNNSPPREAAGLLSLETGETLPEIHGVSLWGDNVKDVEGYRAVFTEQGTSASQLTAAKFLDTIWKLSGVAGEASDAVSAYTQVKMTEPRRLSRFPTEECPEIWIRVPPRQRHWTVGTTDDPVVLLERNLHGHPLAGLLWERKVEEVLFQNGWEEVTTCECLHVHTKLGLFLSVYVIEKKLERSRTLDLCGRSTEGYRPQKSNAINEWSPSNSLTTTGEAGGKDQAKDNIRLERSLLGALTWKVMQKSALGDAANYRRKSILSPTAGDTVHRRSPDTTRRIWNKRDGSEMLVFVLGKNGTTSFTVVSKYSGKVSNNMEHGFRPKIAEVDQLYRANQRLHTILCCSNPQFLTAAWCRFTNGRFNSASILELCLGNMIQ